MNWYFSYTFCPQKSYHRFLLLLSVILKFVCPIHHFIGTLALITKTTKPTPTPLLSA
jgi:hypothetical protein